MMTALLLYAYCSGLYSSRRITKACVERVDFMMIVAHDAPDFRTIADFRKRHLLALGRLFLQVLKLAEKAGLVKLGHVELDGAKIKANAAKHKAMSYERMKTRETELRAEVDRWFEAAQATDAQEDKLRGASRRGDEMPSWLADKRERLIKIREAREALEAEAAAAAAAKAEAERAAQEKREAENRKRSGPVPRPPAKEPDPKAQRNFTGPDSRVLLTKDSLIQRYNAQAAVDGAKQIIVAHGLTQNMSDCPQLVPLVDAVRANLGRKPREISADAGYCSEGSLKVLAIRKIKAYVATGRAKHPADSPRKVGGEMTQTMRQKLKRAGHRSRYRLRKQIVEPVFGQIKQARGFRQFLLRGLEAVKAKWALICTAHNITKLAKAIRGRACLKSPRPPNPYLDGLLGSSWLRV
jgi:hypothetical protein